jgi:hypothetical protein
MNAVDVTARGLASRAAAVTARPIADDGDGYSAPAVLTQSSDFFEQFETFEKHGGIGDGSDETEALTRLLYACKRSGRMAFLPASSKAIGFSERIEIPHGTAMMGQSAAAGNADGTIASAGTRLVALAAGAQVLVRGYDDQGNRGGEISNLVIDGGGIGGARTGGLLWIDAAVQRQFNTVMVQDSAADAVTITRAQNCEFLGLFTTRSGANNLVIDRGAGGLRFIGGGHNATIKRHLVVDESTEGTWDDGDFADVGAGHGPYPLPNQIRFFETIFERAAAPSFDGAAYIGATLGTVFDDCIFASGAAISGGGPLIEVGGAANAAVILFRGRTTMTPDPNGVSMLQRSGAAVYNQGLLEFYGGSAGWQVDAGTGQAGCLFNYGGLAETALVTGAMANALVDNRNGPGIQHIAAGATNHFGFRNRGQVYDKFLVESSSGSGGIVLGDGTRAGDVRWRRNGIGQAQFTGTQVFESPLKFGSAAGPQLRWGAGSPEGVVIAPPGSIYLCSDGGAGATLYVKESGADDTGWAAK